MSTPRITVLLATHNGLRWLPEQLDSILSQEGVEVGVTVLDDMSTDGTYEWLLDQAAKDPRLTVLPRQGSSGGAAANFYRLLDAVDIDSQDCDLIALADQDDLWLPGKLAAQADLVRTRALDGISSNVTAFGEDGSRSLIKKDYPQRRLDYLLESPGPGSTFLLTPRLVRECRQAVAAHQDAPMEFHDWLIYGVCRALGWRWLIQPVPTVDYRQHESNAFGANTGVRSALSRIGLINQKWHRAEAIKMARVAVSVASPDRLRELDPVLSDLTARGFGPRLRLVRLAPQLRRRPRDRVLIAGLILIGMW